MNLLALGCISQIDNFYAKAIKECPHSAAVKNPPKIEEKVIAYDERTRVEKWLYVFYRYQHTLYVSLYFYFAPFMTTVLTYLVAGTTSH